MTTQHDIARWAAATFPDATLDDTLDKFGDEVEELYECLERDDDGRDACESVGELADVAILLYQIAERSGVDLDMAVAGKFDELKARTWARQADGTYQHVEEG